MGNGDFKSNLIYLLFLIPVMLISFTVHELSHGYTAYKLGDPTARNFGRLTLNPVKHLDLGGVLLLLFVGFGWAKPVPVNPRYFRKPKRDMALVSFAGPAANILLAFFGTFIYRVILAAANNLFKDGTSDFLGLFVYFVLYFFDILIMLNLSLAFFNLIPLPPLDGSKLLDLLLPPKASYYYNQISRFGFIILLILLQTPILSVPLNFLVSQTYSLFHTVIGFIPFL